MKAKDFNGTIKVYDNLPKSYGGVINFHLLSDSDLQGYGFYDVVIPSFNSTTQELGDIYFDSDNSQFTYPVNNRTWTQSLSDLKSQKISELKDMYNKQLGVTDWYIIRNQENGTAIPSEVTTQRSSLRTDCANHETAINAKTTKADVVGYTMPTF